MTRSTGLPGHRTHPTRVTAALAGLLTLALALSACAGGSGGSSSPSSAPRWETTSEVDTLKIANAVAIDTLDPAENAANESIWLDQNIYARLVQTDPSGTRRSSPTSPTSGSISADGLTYTFHLRPDAKFADGTPVTAQDATWSIKRARDVEDSAWGFLITPVTDDHRDRRRRP